MFFDIVETIMKRKDTVVIAVDRATEALRALVRINEENAAQAEFNILSASRLFREASDLLDAKAHGQ